MINPNLVYIDYLSLAFKEAPRYELPVPMIDLICIALQDEMDRND